jgi:hypothetical protein
MGPSIELRGKVLTMRRWWPLFGLVHISGDNKPLTANQFSFSVPAANITPPGADPTLILVAGGADNILQRAPSPPSTSAVAHGNQ